MKKQIKTYRKNTEEITCRVKGLTSLDGYTPTLTVKDKIKGTQKFSITGNITDLLIDFRVSPSNNDISAGEYIYDITISDGTDNYTVAQGKYVVLESVRYSD